MMALIQGGLLIYGALYCVGVFAAALSWGNRLSVFLILVCAALTYFSYFGHAYMATRTWTATAANIVNTLVYGGIILGALAGVTLFYPG